MNTLEQLNQLTMQQVRALAYQQKIAEWNTESRGTLLRKLVRISENQQVDLLHGEEA